MADGKQQDWESFPGVVTDQPTEFETTDEAHNTGLMEPLKPDEENENVERDGIQPLIASQKFKNKILTSEGVDFSDLGSGLRGYMGKSYEHGGAKETPKAKFERLQMEVKDLQEDLASIKVQSAKDASEDNTETVQLAEQVRFLHEQLQQVKLDQMLGGDSPLLSDTPFLQKELTKRLLGEISKYQTQTASAGSATTSDKSGDAVTYELYYRPEHEKFSAMARATELERRLEKLEKLVGHESLEELASALDTTDISVQGAVLALTSRAQALSEENLTDLDRRLQSVINQLEAAQKKKQGATDPEAAQKINEMYETTKRWDAIADSVPEIVRRLKALKTLHEQGAEFGRTLTHLEAAQHQISETLSSQGATLNTVQESFDKNMNTIKSNFEALDKRIDALWANLSKAK